MPEPDRKHADSELGRWKRRLDELVARRRFTAALKLLDQIINDTQPTLFEESSWLVHRRRVAWLYRIDLLRGLGRLHEALAWTCLECELQPENVTAKALRERLKRQIRPEPALADSAKRRLERDGARDLWHGIAGMRELKAILERDVILPLQEPELYRQYKVSLPNGVLLYGPPGCGKTFIARKLSELLAFHFIEIKPSDLASTYVHGGQEKIGKLFAEARAKAPCLIFFDELDALLPNRGGDLYHSYAAEVNEFLAQLNDCARLRILVVGATNLLEKIDPAAQRPGRFDKKIYIGPPDMEARVELLRLYMTDRPQEAIDWLPLARESKGYTCAEIELIVNEAARRALERRRIICAEDLMVALSENPPAHVSAKATEGETQDENS